MVKKENKRVMVTFTPKTAAKVEYLCEFYDMTLSQVVQLLVTKEFEERKVD